ncbi:MAG: polysaccharide deacetylase family protein [Bacteroidota bacterium]
MAKKIQIVLDCEDSLKKKAAYTFQTFFEVLGLDCCLSSPTEVSSADVVIWYGHERPSLDGHVLFICASREAQSLFHKKLRLGMSKTKKIALDGEDSLALFFDEEFRKNPAVVVSGDNRCRTIHVDIIASAFYFLSCWQEITSPERDRHERFPASASLQHRHSLLHLPIVNQHIMLLRKELEGLSGQRLPQLPRFAGRDFAVCMTHDVDYLRKWTLGIVYRELVQYFLLGREGGDFGRRLKRLRAFLKALSVQGDPYRSSIGRILKLEKESGVHSTFYCKTGVTSRHDVSYRLSDGYGQSLLKMLAGDGHEVGLHPSYNTFLDRKRMRVEQERLECALHVKPVGVRQHFLRFRIPETWKIQAELGFVHDATLGFSDHEGFRAAICQPFRPYDADNDGVIPIWEIPLLLMDGTLQSYRNKSADESLEIIKNLIMTVKKYHGVGVLLFHNTCYDGLDFPGWGSVFEESLRFSMEEGAFVGSASEILNSYLETSIPPLHA